MNELTVPCPACNGKGQMMGRVQYRDGRGCRNEMCECPICDGRKQVSLDEAMQFNRKHAS